MASLGVSRCGRVRKKSAKVVEMEQFEDHEMHDDRSGAGQALKRRLNQSPPHLAPFADSSCESYPGSNGTSGSGACHPAAGRLRPTQAPVIQTMQATGQTNQVVHGLMSGHMQQQQQQQQQQLMRRAMAPSPRQVFDPHMNQEESSSSSSSETSSESSENDSDSDSLPYPLQKVHHSQMPTSQQHQQQILQQKGRRPKQTAPQRNRQYSSSNEYDPPYNPKTGAAKISANSVPMHKAPPRIQKMGLKQPMESDMSSSNEEDEDSDEDSDSNDSLVIDSGDGLAKKAPLRKLKLPVATAAALANAQRQKQQQQQDDGLEDEPSEDNDDDDDDFVPSSAKRRRSSSGASRKPPPEKKPEEVKKAKAPSAYVLYCTETRKKLLAENPALTFSELSKRMGQMWNFLPDKDKQLWKRKAKTLQAKNAGGLISTGKPAVAPAPKTPQKVTAPPLPTPQAPPRPHPKHVTPPAPKSAPTPPSTMHPVITNYQDLLDKPVEAPPKPFGNSSLDAAAHLKLLGESLTTIGTNLMEHQGPIAVSGSLSVLLDSTLCALGPLICLTAELDEMNGCRQETLTKILNNIAYIMPGL